jgi:hypothetical protein
MVGKAVRTRDTGIVSNREDNASEEQSYLRICKEGRMV